MTRYFLTRIKVEGFRGINNETEPLELKFRVDCVNSVYAINGLGKSSVYEALNYAIRGNVPKLSELQAQERPDEYYCNKFHSQGTATIEIAFEADDGSPKVEIIVQRDSAGNRTVTSPTGTPNPESFLDGLNQDFTLLDYQTFERFIDSSPLERGRSFSALLGLSIYSDFRQTLQAISDTRVLNTDLDVSAIQAENRAADEAAKSALRRLTASYEAITGTQITDMSQMEQYEKDIVSALSGIALLKPEVQGKELGQVDFSTIKDLIKKAEGGDLRKELERLIAVITEAQGIGLKDNETYLQEQKKLLALVGEKDALISGTPGAPFKTLYDAAKSLIDTGEWKEDKKCPLCLSDIETAISDLVEEQLDKYEKVNEKIDELIENWKTAKWVNRLNSLERASFIEIKEEEKKYRALSQVANSGNASIDQIKEAIASFTTLENKLDAELTRVNQRKEEIEKELPPSLVQLTEQVEHARQFREALQEYREKTALVASIRVKLNLIERWKQYVNKASTVFSESESELSRKKIDAIDQEYKDIFERIMGVKDVVPELKRADRREDLHVQLSNFHGQRGLSARALLSESFRNALAIAVFLSAAMRQTGMPRFIILDDVTSSFDSGHQWNLMEVIRNELQQPNNSVGLQFIILSHDSLLEKYFDKIGNTTDWHHQKLQGMPPMGMVLSQAQDSNRLRTSAERLLDAGQEQEAKPLIRQYLEFKMLKIIQKIKIPVPLDFAIKDDRKMVSNCIDAISAAIELHSKAGDLVLDAQQQNDFKNVLAPALIANWINHYETDASASIAPAVLKGVLDTIDGIAECFRYDDTTGASSVRKWYRSLSQR